jgi:hypothetical protein
VKVRFLDWYLMLQSRRLANDSRVRCLWIHETSSLSILRFAAWAARWSYSENAKDSILSPI